MLAQLKKAYGMMPQTFLEEPVSVFQRQLYIHPFLEDDIHEILDIMGEDHVLFGSDFPHPEASAIP